MQDLFDNLTAEGPASEWVGPATLWLHGFVSEQADGLLQVLQPILKAAPLRHLLTPGGHRMSVAMTNCGDLGWVSDRRGYRYQRLDPVSGRPWPDMPQPFRAVASDAASQAGFPDFQPDVCLINRYRTGDKLSLHQDKDEAGYQHPIVSVSIGVPATFLLGGQQRSDPTVKLRLVHGDVLVWGGPDRLRFHGVQPLQPDRHPLTGTDRLNLTFRRARP